VEWLTENELREAERYPRLEAVPVLAAEVRRLRRLIEDLGSFQAAEAQQTSAFATLYGPDYVRKLAALRAEAEAIGDERDEGTLSGASPIG
jgi:hypothetical protein